MEKCKGHGKKAIATSASAKPSPISSVYYIPYIVEENIIWLFQKKDANSGNKDWVRAGLMHMLYISLKFIKMKWIFPLIIENMKISDASESS